MSCLDDLEHVQDELQKVKLELNEVHESRGFKILNAISASRKSVYGMCRLPFVFWNILNGRREIDRAPVLNSNAVDMLHRPAGPGYVKPVRILAIVDEFTELCFGDECELWMPGPETSENELALVEADFLFVESAWKGNGGRWFGRLEVNSPSFLRLLEHARRRSIPTVFWNKEDPVHFEHFLPLARHFDWVLTTAVESVDAYKEALASDQVGVMPFACQPMLHNPLDSGQRRPAAMFAGSYYVKYPERNDALVRMVDLCAEFMPVEIFDRNYHSQNPEFNFPADLVQSVVGGLQANQVPEAYRKYSFAINVNTVTESKTMLSRRVFELLASGAVVLSNNSRAIDSFFGDLIITGSDDEIRRRVASLLQPLAWKRHSLSGLRKVLEEHTWQKRIIGISTMLGLDYPAAPSQEIWGVSPVDTLEEIERVVSQVSKQKKLSNLFLITSPSLPANVIKVPEWVTLVPDSDSYNWVISDNVMLVGFCADDWYGPNYLHDLVLGLSFGCRDGVGKAAFLRSSNNGLVFVESDEMEYCRVTSLSARRALLRRGRDWFKNLGEAALAVKSDCVVNGVFAGLDIFNYCADCKAPVDDAMDDISSDDIR